MQPETSSSDITIHLRRDTAGAHTPTSEITVRLSEGVDLGSVGRALGLYPHTVRLNGYYISRAGHYYVSPGLSWGPLLDFFAQRGLPCGNSEGDAIVVQGKHAGSTDGNAFLKREFELVIETPLKKRKLEANYRPNESVTPSTKRSLKFQLEMESPPKKRMLEANLKPNKNVTISTKRSRTFQSEMESPLKKRKDGTNYKPSENVTLFPKRSLNSDDVPAV
ncbi:amino acid-ligase [Rhynchospora pubera]|uniref:Amino acid-ligase n=1 Tax=Rhynchospora pubera TaxID=906938 RepID=A0AAV8DVE2_9POAL|nr:amino acid-ligase [Rhynchospora pubera]